jgi:hypothetical protein
MPGVVSLTLEREPDYFADAQLPGMTKQTIVAEEAGRLVCAGYCVHQLRFVNGALRRVGYLGGLRLDPAWAGRFDVLRRGYEYFHELQTPAPADFYFTSVAADNERARRFLERGLPGLPRYEFLGEYVTMLLPVRGRLHSRPGRHAKGEALDVDGARRQLTEFFACLQEHQEHYQFTLGLSPQQFLALEPLGLREEDLCLARIDGRIRAAGLLWDQRRFKQTVIRGYSSALAMLRPAMNAWGRLAGAPRLPRVGESLAQAFAAHVACAPDDSEGFVGLVERMVASAAERRLEYLTLGLAAKDPRAAAVRRVFRGREYQSRLYLVHWPDAGQSARCLDGRTLAPEVAWL